MTTGKRKFPFKRILLGALSIILALALSGCAEWNKKRKYDGLFSNEEEPEWNVEHEYATYAIVVASDVSSAVYDAAGRIAEKLAENTGAYAERFYAHEDIPADDDVCRIFVGDVGIESTSKYLRGFRSEDIGYKYHDKCVYIGGITDTALLRAIGLFMDEVVVYADKGFFMNEDTEVFVKGDYDVDDIKLCGFSLGEYTIVYPNGNDKLRTIANYFSMKFLMDSGYMIPVCSDADLATESRVMLLGDCAVFEEHKVESEPDKAKIVRFDSGVMFVAEQPSAIKVALERLENELLKADENGQDNVPLDSDIVISFDYEEASVLSVRGDSFELSRSDMLSIIEKIRECNPDIIRLESASADSVQSVFSNFSDTYELITLSDGSYHMITKGRYTYERSAESGFEVLRYKRTDKSAELRVIELFDEPEDVKGSLSTALRGGVGIIFSDSLISGVDGVVSATSVFESGGADRIDSAYFSGEALSPVSYDVTHSGGVTYSHTQIKIISFK